MLVAEMAKEAGGFEVERDGAAQVPGLAPGRYG